MSCSSRRTTLQTSRQFSPRESNGRSGRERSPRRSASTASGRRARRWGDARKGLTLFRCAGETANDRDETVTRACLKTNLQQTDKEATIAKLRQLSASHLGVLVAITARRNPRTGAVDQPVTTARIAAVLQGDGISEQYRLGERAIREVVRNLETMGLVEAWIESRG